MKLKIIMQILRLYNVLIWKTVEIHTLDSNIVIHILQLIDVKEYCVYHMRHIDWLSQAWP